MTFLGTITVHEEPLFDAKRIDYSLTATIPHFVSNLTLRQAPGPAMIKYIAKTMADHIAKDIETQLYEAGISSREVLQGFCEVGPSGTFASSPAGMQSARNSE